MEEVKKIIKAVIIIIAVFWVLAFFGTTDVVLCVTGAIGALMCILGLSTTLLLWRLVTKIEELQKTSCREGEIINCN